LQNSYVTEAQEPLAFYTIQRPVLRCNPYLLALFREHVG
jgi:hypothetical protein